MIIALTRIWKGIISAQAECAGQNSFTFASVHCTAHVFNNLMRIRASGFGFGVVSKNKDKDKQSNDNSSFGCLSGCQLKRGKRCQSNEALGMNSL